MPLDQPRGDNANHSRVPVSTRDGETTSFAEILRQLPPSSLSSSINLTLSSPPLGVRPTQLNSNLLSPRRVLGQEQLHARISPIKPTSSIDSRCEAKSEITLIQPLRLTFRHLQQSPNPRPLSPPNLSKTPLHKRPVLSYERHNIRHGRKGNQVKITCRKGGRGVLLRALNIEP
jgi:hypothetical protein